MKDNISEPRDGFVFAATGATYRALARRAARSLRQVMPGATIDLFTDAPVNDAVFDKEWQVDHVTHRPKMEALRRSRFDRTVYLDCDTVVVADCSDLFEVLKTFDVAVAHDMYGNATVPLTSFGDAPPAALRQVNSGVLGIRRNAQTQRLLSAWQDAVIQTKARWDQPVLSHFLWTQQDIRLCILPPEYNFMHTAFLIKAGARMAAPRILHLPKLHTKPGIADHPDQPFDLTQVLTPQLRTALRTLLDNDRSLGAKPTVAQFLSDVLNTYPAVEQSTRRLRRLFW